MPNKKITYRRATFKDIEDIVKFVDFWLSGRAKAKGIKTGGNDYFVTKNQHKRYLKSCYVLLAIKEKKIVGWGVREKSSVLIHLLISGEQRGQGIGKKMMKMLKPDIIRSKSDQQTENPASFYEKLGYMKFASTTKVGKKANIDMMVKRTNG